ncbi:MAG: ABC transporter permease [Candidatus Kapaibacteriales bacterium]
MKIIDEILEGFTQSFDSMKSNKLRTFLATLGVVIGISFVVLMGWALSGLDNAFMQSIRTLGEDILYVDKWDWAGGKRWEEVRNRKPITLYQAKQLIKGATFAELAVPVASTWNVKVKVRNDIYSGLNVLGTSADYGQLPSGEVSEGRFFTPLEERSTANIAVLGYKVATSLFPNHSPLGQIIFIEGRKFLVVGVIKKQGTMFVDFMDDRIYIPLGTFLNIYGGLRSKNISVAIKVKDIYQMDESREEVRGLMRSIRNLKPWQDDDFSINETKAFEEIIGKFRLYIWGTGIGMTILSFIVGIIGIMNIMFVSVAERTKEIGIRKAVGAKNRYILFQFLVESASLCIFGALSSIAFCSILVFLLATFLPKVVPDAGFLEPIIPFNFILIASIVAIIVGIFAGLLPAIRASRIDPIESLRYE